MSEEYLTHASELYRTSVHDKGGAIGLQAPSRAGTAASFTVTLFTSFTQSSPNSAHLPVKTCIALICNCLEMHQWTHSGGSVRRLVRRHIPARPRSPVLGSSLRDYDGMFITVCPLLYGASNHVPKRATCRSPGASYAAVTPSRVSYNEWQLDSRITSMAIVSTGRFAIKLHFLRCRPRGQFPQREVMRRRSEDKSDRETETISAFICRLHRPLPRNIFEKRSS
jgi:hypothetical protein